MENYSPNSHRSKEQQNKDNERKKLEKVVSGAAKVKKKSSTRKFADVFISEDAANVKNHIFMDVFVPALKKLVSDIVKDGIEMVLYGGTSRRDNSNSSRVSYVSYDRFADRKNSPRTNELSSRNRLDFGDIVFENRGDADMVLTLMEESIDRYGWVTVADMYDMAGLTGPYTGNKYGWTTLRNASIARTSDGYVIKLPKALPID